MAQRYGRNVSSDDESDRPFVENITHTQFPDRFRMPTIEQYKENRDPKEHVHRFRNIMAQYSSNDGLLCLTFPQTFGDLASRWFGRLPPGSISSFSNLSKSLLPVETRHSPTEKMALALITAARKLRPYFQAHKIGVYTNCQLKLIL
ncbi:hypothetical protein LWI29_013501 [Acer saccharum]|uniref:Reverse transcriptase RNase H-like domain-containing protein n=1 Tax=Acer saccharum TaxID=4024 RepID=A0AA39RHI2_ACESA|nr:hypothetical protein LWI29_013501 [Acer saccharum]